MPNRKADLLALAQSGIQSISSSGMAEENETGGLASFERFRRLVKRVISVPKSEIDKRAEEWKALRKTDKREESEE